MAIAHSPSVARQAAVSMKSTSGASTLFALGMHTRRILDSAHPFPRGFDDADFSPSSLACVATQVAVVFHTEKYRSP
jgi:hypothetical protein